jgi:hypothetical protein
MWYYLLEMGLCTINSSRMSGERVLDLGWLEQSFSFSWVIRLLVSNALLYITSHSVSISGLGCDFLFLLFISTSKPSFSVHIS